MTTKKCPLYESGIAKSSRIICGFVIECPKKECKYNRHLTFEEEEILNFCSEKGMPPKDFKFNLSEKIYEKRLPN
ncbi:hypothetical protein J4481_01860 [Candidatus Pacearchaeota archaeon]|nr:hypothetical protein [Candidatus Pacearchaeota archaeon]